MPFYITRLRLALKILVISARTGVEIVTIAVPIARAVTGMVRELKKK